MPTSLPVFSRLWWTAPSLTHPGRRVRYPNSLLPNTHTRFFSFFATLSIEKDDELWTEDPYEYIRMKFGTVT
ncbi:hypothetical protein GBAR_LOCUS25996 [Geodia barretti]|uniref:Uncharacterized protein n=1 Tax=Geodia barretti TaxID=519541 RepID=A0AA35TG73_GEOBA|nr:hypothetical protein GBAR_LOCUS25996 [Geodia barretti]